MELIIAKGIYERAFSVGGGEWTFCGFFSVARGDPNLRKVASSSKETEQLLQGACDLLVLVDCLKQIRALLTTHPFFAHTLKKWQHRFSFILMLCSFSVIILYI